MRVRQLSKRGPGESANGTVWVVIDSDSVGAEGVAGWQFSIAYDEAIEVTNVEVGDDLNAVTGLSSPVGFESHRWSDDEMESVDPTENDGTRGIVDAVVFELPPSDPPVTLPVVGAVHVLRIDYRQRHPFNSDADPPQVGEFRFLDGLRGVGTTTDNEVTVKGEALAPQSMSGHKVTFNLRNLPVAGEFIRGDSNEDGRVDIADPIVALCFILSTGGFDACAQNATDCLDALDFNNDNVVDVTDVTDGIQFQFQTSPTAPPDTPGLSCGFDTDPDPQRCAPGSHGGCP